MLIGKRLKEIRIAQNISQQELADIIGVTKVSVCGYESGKRLPNLYNLMRIANALDVDPNYLLGYDVKVIAEKEVKYQMIITKEELVFISELRKNRLIYNQVIKDPKRSVKYLRHYKTN